MTRTRRDVSTLRTPLLAVLLIALAAGGCARRRPGRPSVAHRPPTAEVNVTNDNWLDISIYVSNGGSRQRVGDLTSLKSATFQIPNSMLSGSGTIYFVVHPIGSGRAWTSPGIALAPGHSIVDLRVDNVITHSTLTVAVLDPEDLEDSAVVAPKPRDSVLTPKPN